MNTKTSDKRIDRFDRMCEQLEFMTENAAPPPNTTERGALDLRKDRSQHRRYHGFFDDLLN